jgi:hypothetical protein
VRSTVDRRCTTSPWPIGKESLENFDEGDVQGDVDPENGRGPGRVVLVPNQEGPMFAQGSRSKSFLGVQDAAMPTRKGRAAFHRVVEEETAP